MVSYAGQNVKLDVDVIEDGWWAIDKVKGKRLMAVALVNVHTNMKYISYVPTTEDICRIIDVYLECERRNDEFRFKDGRTRPAELHRKIKELESAIEQHKPTSLDVIF